MSQEIDNSQDGEEANPTPFRKGELHVESSSEIVVDPVVGFVKAPTVATTAIGDEEMVLNQVRMLGFSEEALTAFKSGKIITIEYDDTPFGRIATERWKGKEENGTGS